jgi:hypothetical protein
MRGAFVLITLLLVFAFFVVVRDAEVVDGAGVITVFPASPRSNTATAAFTPVVDRGDDPMESLACTPAPNDCSLRRALELANEQGQPVTISFADHFVITLAKPLPAIIQNGVQLIAQPGQEVRVNGNYLASPVFHVTAANVRLEGLRIYGAGAGQPNVLINGPARQVTIARNLIGDDDAPEGNCGQNDQAIAGIYVQSNEAVEGARAWVYGNIVECHTAGEGIVVMAEGVTVGADAQGQDGEMQRNVIRHNAGTAVRLDDFGGNTICNNLIHNNGNTIAMTNFTNNLMDNDIRQ